MFIKGWIPSFKFLPSHAVLGIILLFYCINGTLYLRVQSITFDEGSFLSYATRLAKGHPERINQADNSKMPVSVINLLPRAVNQFFHPGLKKKDNGDSDVMAGRYITLLVSILTILLTYKWSKELYGTNAGLFSAFLISFCPNMIANAGLVTTDSYSMLFLALTMYYLWKFSRTRGMKHLILLSLFTGFSQLVKQSLFHLYLLIPGLLFIYYLAFRPMIKWKTFLLFAFLFLSINWFVINAGFYFRDTNTALGNYEFFSRTFQDVQQSFPRWLPVPFPKAFVTGLDLGKYYDQIGGGDMIFNTHGNVTIWGHSSSTGGFWYYYFISIFYKTPIPSLIFITAGLFVIIKSKPAKEFIKNEFFLLAPVVYFLVYMSFIYQTHIGIRQIIFVFPFLYIISGNLMHYTKWKNRGVIISALSVLLIFSVMRYWRNYYPYTNEFIQDKKMAYSYVGAANLEFGQGKFFFEKYLKAHPEVQMASDSPRVGIFLLNTNDYLNVWNEHRFNWLTPIKPFGQVAYNGLLIKVTPEYLEQLQMNKARQ